MQCCACVVCAEAPKGNQHCPRKNGYFAHPDPSVCHLFYNCIDGEFTEVPCTPGLHFDEYQGTCVWPESSGRSGCSKTESELWRGGGAGPFPKRPFWGPAFLASLSGRAQSWFDSRHGHLFRSVHLASCPMGTAGKSAGG
jgi:hypothetical protein